MTRYEPAIDVDALTAIDMHVHVEVDAHGHASLPTDLAEADGTIARVPASFRLWYPSPSAVVALAAEAGLEVHAAFGSHDLAPLDGASERCIVVLRPASDGPGVG